MAEGRADLAVHSMKDVPMEMPEGFVLAAISEREDPRDAFVSPRYAALVRSAGRRCRGHIQPAPGGAIPARFPHLVIKPLRGNLDTRLKKLDEGEYDAIHSGRCRACASRAGMNGSVPGLTRPTCCPAPGQGALGIEICEGPAGQPAYGGWHWQILRQPHASTAERAFSRRLGGSCHLPIAGFAVPENGEHFWLRGLVASVDGTQIVAGECRGPWVRG